MRSVFLFGFEGAYQFRQLESLYRIPLATGTHSYAFTFKFFNRCTCYGPPEYVISAVPSFYAPYNLRHLAAGQLEFKGNRHDRRDSEVVYCSTMTFCRCLLVTLNILM